MTYYLDDLPEGATMAIVGIEQPPKCNGTNDNPSVLEVQGHRVIFDCLDIVPFETYLPYPLGAKVGAREWWLKREWLNPDMFGVCERYEETEMPSSTMPDEKITRWYTVSSVAVKQVKKLSSDEIQSAGYKYLHRMPAILDPKKFDKDKIHDLCNIVAQGVFMEQDENRTPDTWVEVIGLEEI